MYSLDNRHSLALPYWARPGIVSFAKKDDGGGNDDDLDDDEDDTDDDEDDDDPDEGKSEDELRAELKAVRGQLTGVNGQSAKRRHKVRELQRQLTEAVANKGKGKADDDGDKPDADALAEAARTEEREAAKKVRIADKAELALARANVDPAKLARAVRLLDIDDLDLNDDGSLDGIDEQLDTLRDSWPELFTKKRKRPSVAGEHDDGDDDRKGKAGKSTSELQAEQLVKRGR